jgi:hypothetical protein
MTSPLTPDSGAPARKPIAVNSLDQAFGGAGGTLHKILPPWKDIPEEFKRHGGQWVKWQRDWFFSGLKRWPVAREGVDLKMAMANLGVVQRSFEPKHEHKEAGVAYLASLWFTSPDGEPIKSEAKA